MRLVRASLPLHLGDNSSFPENEIMFFPGKCGHSHRDDAFMGHLINGQQVQTVMWTNL